MDTRKDFRSLLLPYFTEDELATLTQNEMQGLVEAMAEELPDIDETERRQIEAKYRDRVQRVLAQRLSST